MYVCCLWKKINTAEELKRFLDLTRQLYILVLKYFYAEIAAELLYIVKQFMAAQMLEAEQMLREGDKRLGLQIEWLSLQKLQPQLSDSLCIVLMSIGPVTMIQS